MSRRRNTPQEPFTFLDVAREVLEFTRKPLTAKKIWDEAVSQGLDKKLGTSGKTPATTMHSRIYKDIQGNLDTSVFVQVSKRPATFFLRSLWDGQDIARDEEETVPEESREEERGSFYERDLHPLLTAFVDSEHHFRCHTKTILHESSKKNKKGFNKWLHPDMVGIYYPFHVLKDTTRKLLDTFKENPYKLFSFEVKIEINFSNLRECYFQAVSNSSWAHEGYLVALRFEEDPDFKDELRRLNHSFGIGIIQLNAEHIEQSEIVFSAKSRDFWIGKRSIG